MNFETWSALINALTWSITLSKWVMNVFSKYLISRDTHRTNTGIIKTTPISSLASKYGDTALRYSLQKPCQPCLEGVDISVAFSYLGITGNGKWNLFVLSGGRTNRKKPLAWSQHWCPLHRKHHCAPSTWCKSTRVASPQPSPRINGELMCGKLISFLRRYV